MGPCIGCVEILKETFQRALTFALRNKGKWSDQCLKKALLSETQVTRILEETLKGEADIEGAAFGSGTLDSVPKKEGKAA